MIKISLNNVVFDNGVILPDPESGTIVFSVTGHSGSAKKGEDIICSAVSALAQTLVLSAGALAGVSGPVQHESGALRLEIETGALSAEQRSVLKVLLGSFLIGAGEIMRQYPSSVKIDFNKE